MTYEKYLQTIPIALLLFIVSCFKNIILCRFVFSRYSSVKIKEVKGRRKAIVFACLSDLIALSVACFVFCAEGRFDILIILVGFMAAEASSAMFVRCVSVLVGMLFIFVLDYFIAFQSWYEASKKQKLLLSGILAVVNAPYLFLIDIGGIIRLLSTTVKI